jgi:signal transduction histidine kinase
MIAPEQPDLQAILAREFDTLPHGVVITGLDGQVITMNRAAQSLTGLSNAPDANLSILDLASGETRVALVKVISSARSGHATYDVHVRAGPDDSAVTVSAEPVTRSGVVLFLRWEFSLEGFSGCGFLDEGDWFRFLADTSHAFAGSLQVETTCQRIVGEAVPRVSDWCTIDLVEPGDQHLRRAAVAHANAQRAQSVRSVRRRYPVAEIGKHPVLSVIRSGEPFLIPEFNDELVRSMTQDEPHFEFIRGLGLRSSMIFPLTDDGVVYGALTFASSESGRLYSDDDVRLVQAYVDRASLAIVMAMAHEETVQLSRIREHFLSVASHEIRTPLAVVGGFAGLLSRKVTSGTYDPAGISVLAAELQQGVERLESLTEELLVASSLQERELPVSREEVDLVELAEHVGRRFRLMLPDKERDRIIVTGQPGLIGRWSSSLLERALSNLLGNAIKYSPDNVYIQLVVSRVDSGHVSVAVSDSGMGISEEDQSRLFEPFARGSSARRMSDGTGLGLHITRQIVEQHSGTIDVTSNPGAGSTFTITLPIMPPA